MNSLQQLNLWGNTSIVYSDPALYQISATGLGSVTISQEEDVPVLIPARVVLDIYDNAYTDLVITITSSSAAIVSTVRYTGSNPSIGVVQNSSTQWQVYGIRDLERYTDVFENLYCVTVGDAVANYSLTVGMADSVSFVSSNYTVSVTMTPSNEYQVPAELYGVQGYTTPVTGIQILDAAVGKQYQITLISTEPSRMLISYLGSASSQLVLAGTRSQLNAILSGDTILLQLIQPISSELLLTYTQVQTTDSVVQANAVGIRVSAAVGDSDFYFQDTILKSPQFPEYFYTGNPAHQLECTIGPQYNGTAISFTYLGVTSSKGFTLVGTGAEIKTALSLITINNYNGSSIVIFDQVNSTLGIRNGQQKFWPRDDESGLRIAGTLILPDLPQFIGYNSALASRDTIAFSEVSGYPISTPNRVLVNTAGILNISALRLTLTVQAGSAGLFRKRTGGTWSNVSEIIISDIADVINDQIHWINLGVTGTMTYSYELRNLTTSTVVSTGFAQVVRSENAQEFSRVVVLRDN